MVRDKLGDKPRLHPELHLNIWDKPPRLGNRQGHMQNIPFLPHFKHSWKTLRSNSNRKSFLRLPHSDICGSVIQSAGYSQSSARKDLSLVPTHRPTQLFACWSWARKRQGMMLKSGLCKQEVREIASALGMQDLEMMHGCCWVCPVNSYGTLQSVWDPLLSH